MAFSSGNSVPRWDTSGDYRGSYEGYEDNNYEGVHHLPPAFVPQQMRDERMQFASRGGQQEDLSGMSSGSFQGGYLPGVGPSSIRSQGNFGLGAETYPLEHFGDRGELHYLPLLLFLFSSLTLTHFNLLPPNLYNFRHVSQQRGICRSKFSFHWAASSATPPAAAAPATAAPAPDVLQSKQRCQCE